VSRRNLGVTTLNPRQLNEAAARSAREGLHDVSHDLGRGLVGEAMLPDEQLEPSQSDASVESPRFGSGWC
jgi:hypothetical protein